MIRDHKLFLHFDEDQQLPLDLEFLDATIQDAVTGLGGTTHRREVQGLFMVWDLYTYQDARHVEARLNEILPHEPRWYLRSENRVAHGPLSLRDTELLLDFTGLSGTKSA